MRIDETLSRSEIEVASSRTMEGSLPPSSRTSGVRHFAADAATLNAISREPMKVMCLIPGCEVKWSATSGKQMIVCTRSGL